MAAKVDRNRTKFLLDEKDMPTSWYNIQADFTDARCRRRSTPAPGSRSGPQDLAPLFPMELIKQEVSQERWIEIPDEVRDVYRLWRPTPLYRARRLEKALDTPARIYYKYEGVSPAGSHKPNTAVAQAYYNKQERRHAARHRDRRRASGAAPSPWRASMFGLRVQGLHGARSPTSRSRTAAR